MSRGKDLSIGGTLIGTLGLPAGNAVAGGGSSDGQGTVLDAQNIFKTLINLRDDCYGVAGTDTELLSTQDSNQNLLGLANGDKATVTFNGNTYNFNILATDTVGDFVSNLQNLLGNMAQVQLASDGRIEIKNLATSQIQDFSISVASHSGTQRTVFNSILSKIPTAIPGLSSVVSDQMFDPNRYLLLGGDDLADNNNDQQNLLSQQAIVGARANRLTAVSNVNSAETTAITGQRTSVESANVAEVLTLLSRQEAVLQSALQVGAKVLPPSLLDFMT